MSPIVRPIVLAVLACPTPARVATWPLAVVSNDPAAPAQRREDPRKRVAKALDLARAWLVAHQSPDGFWSCASFSDQCGKIAATPCQGPGSTAHDVGITALAVLALSRGVERGDAKAFAEPVRKGLDWLAAQQDPDTGQLGKRASHDWVYGHALGTLALCESALRDPGRKPAAQKALELVFLAKNPQAAWRYDQPPIGDNDTSITGWMVHALVAARAAGLDGEFDEAYVDVLQYLDEVTDPSTGRVGYDTQGSLSSRTPANEEFPREHGEAMTALGLVCRYDLGQQPKKFAIMRKHAELVRSRPPVWDEKLRTNDYYYWHHGTAAMQRSGGSDWKEWGQALEEALLDHQLVDPKRDDCGSWNTVDTWSYVGGRVYGTALNCLTLEAYARYLRENR